MTSPTSTGDLTTEYVETQVVERKRRGRLRSFNEVSTREKVVRYVLLLIMLVVLIGPFFYQLMTSLKGPGEDMYSASIDFFPSEPTLQNYVKVGEAIPVWNYILNSIFVAAMSVFGNIILATIAGFAIARLRWWGRTLVIAGFFSTMVLPGEATMVANFVTVRDLGLADSLVGVGLPGMVGALNVLLMWNAFRVIPKEIDEAAIVDGANVWQRLVKISLPAVRGTIAVIAIFAFIGAWDDFLWPLIILTSPEKFTLTVGLQYLAGTFSNNPRLIAAGTMIAFIPIVIVFASLQRYFFKGVEEGGVKG